MVDMVPEFLRAVVVGRILLFLLHGRDAKKGCKAAGWKALVSGFALIFVGTLIDFSDNFDGLDHSILLGDTPVRAFLEKVVGDLLGFILVGIGVMRWRPRGIESQEPSKERPKPTHEEAKILRGILPICASCKKIRDDAGFWKQIEMYISEHSEVKFTHGICPECARKVYAEINHLKKDNQDE